MGYTGRPCLKEKKKEEEEGDRREGRREGGGGGGERGREGSYDEKESTLRWVSH